MVTTANPTRTKRWVGQRVAPRAWTHEPAVHEIVAAVSANPASVAESPRQPTSVSATNASTAKKAQVRIPRRRIAAGSTGRAVSVPDGVSRRNAKSPMTRPVALNATVGMSSPVVSPTVSSPDPSATTSASGSRRRRAAASAGSVPTGASATAWSAPRVNAPASRDERQQPEEDVAPAERLADRAGDRRADDAGEDPGGRERREHPRPERIGEGPPDRDIGDRLDRAGTETLEEARGDEDRHRWREAAAEQADREEPETGRERERQPAPVDRPADDDDPDERAEEERGEDPAVELEAAELARDDRHDRRDRQRLEPDERDGQDEAEGQGTSIRTPEAVRSVSRGTIHTRQGWRA